jgi:hypothetical protein
MNDELLDTGVLGDARDKTIQELGGVEIINTHPALDREMEGGGSITHALEDSGDPRRILHKNRAKGPSLDTLARAPAVEVDVVVPTGLEDPCGLPKHPWVTASELHNQPTRSGWTKDPGDTLRVLDDDACMAHLGVELNMGRAGQRRELEEGGCGDLDHGGQGQPSSRYNVGHVSLCRWTWSEDGIG